MIWAARCRRWTRRRSLEPAPSTRKLIALTRVAGSATRACRACSAGTDVGRQIRSNPVTLGQQIPSGWEIYFFPAARAQPQPVQVKRGAYAFPARPRGQPRSASSSTDQALRSFAGFLLERAPDVTTVNQVTRRHIEDYKPWLAARPGQNRPGSAPPLSRTGLGRYGCSSSR